MSLKASLTAHFLFKYSQFSENEETKRILLLAIFTLFPFANNKDTNADGHDSQKNTVRHVSNFKFTAAF